MITNEHIYNLCQEILTSVRSYSERIIANQREIINKLNTILSTLEEIFEGIKTLSDNDVVLDEKIETIKKAVDELKTGGEVI